MGNNTLESEKSVPVKGKGKEKQIMEIFAVSATCQFLLMQLIYAGKTKHCHPQSIELPSGFDVTYSLNHWSNEELAIQHIREIKEDLGLSKNQKSLLIYNVFKRQTTKFYTDFLLENDLVYVHFPANLTHKLQPLDINVKVSAKGFLKDQFQTRYTDEIQKQMDNGKGVYEVDVDTRLSRMKPIHVLWIIDLYDKLRNSGKMSENGFKAATITEELDPEKDFGEEDPSSHLI